MNTGNDRQGGVGLWTANALGYIDHVTDAKAGYNAYLVCVLILYTGSDNLDSWYLSF
jgi:hypothetical protein